MHAALRFLLSKVGIAVIAGAGALLWIGVLYWKLHVAEVHQQEAEVNERAARSALDSAQATIDALEESAQKRRTLLAEAERRAQDAINQRDEEAELLARLQQQNEQLLSETLTNDPESKEWAADPVPDAIRQRLRQSRPNR